jgi:hypothetical protein
MLALIEAIGGHDKAAAVAAEMGVDSWSPVHESDLFGLNASRMWGYVANKTAFWRHEDWVIDVHDDMDDIALALTADAWSRTGRVSVSASAAGPVKLRSGMVLAAAPAEQKTPRVPISEELRPAQQLDRTLCEIGQRFGAGGQDRVMQELEYPGVAKTCER